MTSYQNYPPGRRPSGLPMVLAGAAFVMAAWMLLEETGWLRSAPEGRPRPVAARGELAPLEQNFIDIFARTSPSVAHITTRSLVRNMWGVIGEQSGTGSGFVWDDRGTLVTNYHVVQNARTVGVTFGERRYRARYLNGSPEYDLAVLQLEGDLDDLAPIPLGTSGDLRVGQTAIAIGNPFGFDQTMTTGVISALDRNLPTEDGRVLPGLIQVDAAINPGNSGGPLLDSAGRLIGVTTAIYSPSGASAGLGFAVPVDTVNEVVPSLLASAGAIAAGESAQRAVLGVRNVIADPRYRTCDLEDLGLDYQRGAIVTETVPGSGAAAAGIAPFRFDLQGRPLQYGDVIVQIDDSRIRSFNELGEALRGKRPGQTVQVTLVRGLPERARVERVTVELSAADG